MLVINSQKRKIDTAMLQQLGIETSLDIVLTFPWACMSQSVHRILSHAWEKVTFNENFGLGSDSEEGLEALNKYIRQIRARRSRTNSTHNNFKDVFNHLWRKSSPKIVAMEREKRKRKKTVLLCLDEIESFKEKFFLE